MSGKIDYLYFQNAYRNYEFYNESNIKQKGTPVLKLNVLLLLINRSCTLFFNIL